MAITKKDLDFMYYGGQAFSLENAADKAKRSAGDFYAAGLDVEAKIWRNVAVWLGELSCEARKEQKKHEKIFAGGGISDED